MAKRTISVSAITLFIVFVSGMSYIGLWFYNYLSVKEAPTIEFTMVADGYYAGDIENNLKVSSVFKLSTIEVRIDDRLLVTKKCNQSKYDELLLVPTATLSDGPHTFSVRAIDATYHQNEITKEIVFHVDNVPLQALQVKPDGDACVYQGKTFHLQIQVNKPINQGCIKLLSRSYPLVAEHNGALIYEAFVPINSEEMPQEYPYIVEIEDNVSNVATIEGKFQIVRFPFRKQNLKVDAQRVKKEADEASLTHAQLQKDIETATAASPIKKLWRGLFYIPCDARGMSTEFGTLRTTQDRGRYAHNAIDFLASPRSSVWACQDGIIAFTGRYAISGNTVCIDHGCGILTLYFHLDSIAPLSAGDPITKGMPIGTVGMTGYANGYHLHWEMRIYNTPVDPIEWTKYDF